MKIRNEKYFSQSNFYKRSKRQCFLPLSVTLAKNAEISVRLTLVFGSSEGIKPWFQGPFSERRPT